MQSNKTTFSSIIFFTGIALGLALALAAIWPDYEAIRYFFTGAVYSPFHGLKCPVFITRSETATLSASIDNRSERAVQPVYKVEISGPLGRSLREQIAIQPHQTQNVQWTVDANDIDLGSFIFSKLTVLSFAGNPTREASCGILVLNLNGVAGKTILYLALGLSLLGMIVGLVIWEGQMEIVSKGFMQPQLVRRALALTVLLAMLSGFLSWWLAGILFVVLSVLLLVITVLAVLRG